MQMQAVLWAFKGLLGTRILDLEKSDLAMQVEVVGMQDASAAKLHLKKRDRVKCLMGMAQRGRHQGPSAAGSIAGTGRDLGVICISGRG
jgi:hypothetical protein